MTEEKRRRRPRSEPGRDSDGTRRPRKRQPVAELAQRARDQVSEITGLEPEGVTSVKEYEEGTWRVLVELLEVSRIPEALDVIGSYEVEVDEEGRLLRYERVRRYARSDKSPQQPVREG